MCRICLKFAAGIPFNDLKINADRSSPKSYQLSHNERIFWSRLTMLLTAGKT